MREFQVIILQVLFLSDNEEPEVDKVFLDQLNKKATRITLSREQLFLEKKKLFIFSVSLLL